jgi:hypothetical protein
MKNPYRWLNKRHSDKQFRKTSKSLKELKANPDKKIFHTWDEMEEWLEARRIKRQLAPWWQKAYHRVHLELFGMHGLLTYQVNPRIVINRSVWRYQRGKRGWADFDTWSADSYIAKVMSGMLLYMAEHSHAYPGDNTQWDTWEKWQAYLRDLAARLAKWDDDTWTDETAFETTKNAVKEFSDNFGYFWD